MKVIYKVKGLNGIVYIFEEKIVISRKSFGGYSTYGVKGDRTYYYNDIVAFEYKRPGMTNGYLKILIPGAQQVNSRLGQFTIGRSIHSDENVITLTSFSKKKSKLIDEAVQYLEERISNSKNTETSKLDTNSKKIDDLDRIIDLFQEGLLSKDEFEILKSEFFEDTKNNKEIDD